MQSLTSIRLLIGAAVGLCALAIAGVAATPTVVEPAQPRIPARTFNVRDYGATGDGRTADGPALKTALAAAQRAGGGTLVVPAGDYLTGPLDLFSQLNLRLEKGARLRFSDRRADYPVVDGKIHPLLWARDCEDVMISGAGIIDGQGQAWWNEFRRGLQAGRGNDDHPPVARARPLLLVMDDCRRVCVEGVTLMNSPMYQCVPRKCTDVTISGITIEAPNTKENHAFNTDGIDPFSSQRVLISHCVIDTGDDCIALKSTTGFPVADVLITDCTFRNGHGCSIGSGTSGDVRNVTVQRCTFEGTNVGIQLKSHRDRGGRVENLIYTDITMKNVPIPILLSMYYPGRITPKPGDTFASAPVTPLTPTYRDIVIRNVTSVGSPEAGRILGLPEMPVTDVLLENVRIEAERGMRLSHVQGVRFKDVHITTAAGAPLLVDHGVRGLDAPGLEQTPLAPVGH